MRRPRKTTKPTDKPPLTNAEAQIKVARIERSTRLLVAIVTGLAAIAVAGIGARFFHAH